MNRIKPWYAIPRNTERCRALPSPGGVCRTNSPRLFACCGIVLLLLEAAAMAGAQSDDRRRPRGGQRTERIDSLPASAQAMDRDDDWFLASAWDSDDEANKPPDHDRHPARRPGFGSWFRLDEDQRTELLDFVDEHFPELSRRLKNRGQRIPIWFRRHVGRLMELMEITKTDPKRGTLMIRERRLEMKMHVMTERFRRAPGPGKRNKLERELTKLCTEWYEVRLELRGMMIQELEERLDALKTRHESFRKNRETMIAREFKRQIRRAEGKGPVEKTEDDAPVRRNAIGRPKP